MDNYQNITSLLNGFYMESRNCSFGRFQWIDYQYTFKAGNNYTFTGKELDSETGYSYFGARYYDADLSGLFFSVDPMADKYPNMSPYAYCAWNPVKLVDPDGRKDRPFRQGVDKDVSEKVETRTPIFIFNDKGEIAGLHPNHKKAYNCHSYAWHNSKGDSNPQSIMPCDIMEVYKELPKWDNNPADDILELGAVQLDVNDNNAEGDRVIYYSDENGNGRYDDGEYIAHSAIVQQWMKKGIPPR